MPTPRPFRLRVLDAISDALKAVTPGNGYQNDLSDFERESDGEEVTVARVYRGRDQFGFNDPRPMVSILEHPRALDQLHGTQSAPNRAGDWELLIQGFVQDDPDHPTDPAHILAAEVTKRLVEEKVRVGNNHDTNILGLGSRKPCVTALEVGPAVCRPADEGISDVAYFFMTVRLSLAEDLENPFA